MPRSTLDRDLLTHMLAGRVVVACVGNQWRADDGLGPLVAALLEPSNRVRVIDCGETPENYLGVIARMKPDRVLVVDAADFGGEVGEVRTVAKQSIKVGGVSTHAPRLTLFADFVEAQTKAETYFIAIQPGSLEFGKPVSAEVDQAARELADMINEVNRDLDRFVEG